MLNHDAMLLALLTNQLHITQLLLMTNQGQKLTQEQIDKTKEILSEGSAFLGEQLGRMKENLNK